MYCGIGKMMFRGSAGGGCGRRGTGGLVYLLIYGEETDRSAGTDNRLDSIVAEIKVLCRQGYLCLSRQRLC